MNLFFDAVIFGFLLTDFAVLLFILKQSPPSKKLVVIQLGFLVCWAVVFYGSFIEPRSIVVKEESISFSESPQKSLRVAVLSDIHTGPYKKEAFVQKAVQTILDQNPDFVFLLGDFIYSNIQDLVYLAPLTELTDNITTYGVLGNHDYDLAGFDDDIDEDLVMNVKQKLMEYGVIVMENESYPIDTQELWISGVKEIWTNEGSIEQSISNRPPTTPHTILLAHNPDIVKEIKESDNIDLVLAGHTHGGQIRLPLIGPVGIIPDELGQEYDKGWFEYEGTPLYITSGIGESGPRARLFNKPEIIILTINY